MHTFRAVESQDDANVYAYEVGYFEPTDDGGENWHVLHTFKFAGNAARFVNFLNGGSGEMFVEDDEDA